MKYSSTNLALWLAASACANPLPPPQNKAAAVSAAVKANVTSTIDQWLNAIKSVNTFVDTVGAVKDAKTVSSMASTAFVAAQLEGASNTILQQDVTLDASGAAAAQGLLAKFNIIGPAINDTIFNPGNVQKNLNAINGARCPAPVGQNAIGQEGDVQQAAALAVGISVPPPQLPNACNAAKPRQARQAPPAGQPAAPPAGRPAAPPAAPAGNPPAAPPAAPSGTPPVGAPPAPLSGAPAPPAGTPAAPPAGTPAAPPAPPAKN